jgi:hypothetical protein
MRGMLRQLVLFRLFFIHFGVEVLSHGFMALMRVNLTRRFDLRAKIV